MALAQTGRLGLHHTQAEVTIWQARAANGPYQAGWNNILTRANAFVANPEARWAGNTTGACWANSNPAPQPPGILRTTDAGLRDAAFAYVITGTTSYRDAARTALLAQANTAGTDWGNQAIWCRNDGNTANYFNIANWFRRLIYGYSYIRPSLSAADQTTLDAWLDDGAEFFESLVNLVVERRFPGRLADNYNCTGSATYCPGAQIGITHTGGYPVYNFHNGWANPNTAIMASVAAAAAITNNAAMLARSERFAQEFIRYGVFPGGQIMDQYRGNVEGSSHRAYRYPGFSLGSALSIADHLARNGDTGAYDYTSADGLYGTQGTSKSFLTAMQHYAGQTNGTIIEYSDPTTAGDPNELIDPDMDGEYWITHIFMAAGNLYYGNAAVNTAIERALPATYNNVGCNMLSGEWCNYPDIRFMFQATGADPYTSQVVLLRPALSRCYVQCQPQGTKIYAVIDDNGNSPISGNAGFTARVDTVADAVTGVSCGAGFSGYAGTRQECVLTLTTGVTTCAEAVDITYSEGTGNVVDSQGTPQELEAFTQTACTVHASLLNDDNITSATTPTAGRPVSAMVDAYSAVEADSYVHDPADTAIVTFDLGAAVNIESFSAHGDITGNTHCGDVAIDHSDNGSTWAAFLTAQDCTFDRNTLLTWATTPASHRYWRATINGNNPGTGVQIFYLGATAAGGDPPPDPPAMPTTGLIIHGTGLQGVILQ